jgi:DNA polymerase-3 subunit beta
MKLLIGKQDLAELIGKVQNVVPSKPAMPILHNILVEAVGDELVLTATDLTVGIRAYCAAKVLEPGATTLPARRFFQLIRELTMPMIELTTGANEITEIVAGSSRFKLHGMHKAEFPALPDFRDATQFRINSDTLKEMLQRTAYAVSREDTRYALTGVLMELHQGQACFVGTDGKRLAKATASISDNRGLEGQCILPLKAVEELSKLLDNTERDVTVFVAKDRVAIDNGPVLLVSKLVAGDYPDYRKVIPAAPQVHTVLHREELVSLLRQVALFTGEHSSSVRFTLMPGELRLAANSREIGEGRVSMPVDYHGQQIDIAFNPSYFLDILRHTKDETVQLSLTDPFNPALITDSSSSLSVLMPMRLQEV